MVEGVRGCLKKKSVTTGHALRFDFTFLTPCYHYPQLGYLMLVRQCCRTGFVAFPNFGFRWYGFHILVAIAIFGSKNLWINRHR